MKQHLKLSIRILSVIVVSPLILLHLLAQIFVAEGLFQFISQLLSLVPGTLGSYLRVAFYQAAMTECQADIRIDFGSFFSHRNVRIDSGVYIGAQCNIGMSHIGRDTMIASGVHIMSGNKQHHIDSLDEPMQQQGGTFESIDIGEDCWIGNGALIMASIGRKSIIGAGSVVTRKIPEYSIAVGNPARVVRSRRADNANPAQHN
jgi:virginiamycin A acetyltransferase